MRHLLACLALAILVVLARPAGAAFDPTLELHQLETPHFRVTYHTGLEEVAQHVASTAESIYDNMTTVMGHVPEADKTEVLLTDTAESANGSATALPYNALRLLVTAPEDMSPLGDVDDWFLELVTHELTHILHTDNIHGIPVLVNRVIGKQLAPNQIQPRWILEGLAVYQETAHTSGGRLRSSQWNMYMRADVLEDNVAGLDQISNTVRRWPQGNLWYLYGSHFIQWIQDVYGPSTFPRVSRDYGAQVIPWGMQRSIRRITGKTYDELYPEWIRSMQRTYGAQAAAVRKEGLREGRQLTFHGQDARYPRWIPKGAWPEHEGGLLYYREDQHDRPGLYAVDFTRDANGAVVSVDPKQRHPIARVPIPAYASFQPDGGVVFGSTEVYRNVFSYGDLERMAPGATSRFGTPDGGRERITEPALRAADPAVSPDGRRIVFTQNHAGTRSIHLADLVDGHLENITALAATPTLEQSFTPRWSPDGTHVAYSTWRAGGYRDIRYVDVRDRSWRMITTDRAIDGAPAFTPDGKWLLFHSDRTGISNVYAHELATGVTKQITNVINGAYMPDVSPDGRTLAYIGYTKKGFDLFAMPLDTASAPDAPAAVDDRPEPPRVEQRRWPTTRYRPWRTLVPRTFDVSVAPGYFGQSVGVSMTGSDISGLHGVALSTTTELARPYVQGALSYSYGGLPVDFGASVYRTVVPRTDYTVGDYKPVVMQETLGVSTSLSYALPRAYDSQGFTVSHTVGRVGADLPLPADKVDPFATPTFFQRGLQSSIHLGYSYTNAERYLWSVGAERGFSFSVGFDWTNPALGSDFTGFATNADLTTYFKMPWLNHHSLALHAGGGTSGGNFPGRNAFFVSGFVDLPLIDVVRNQQIQGGVVLRGYPLNALSGRSYLLTNAEYRFPIVNIDRGDSTLPIFLNRITGAAFTDYGSAFDIFSNAAFKTGVGGELWFDFTLGYIQSFTFRTGLAQGLASRGITKPYFVAAVPF